MVIKNRVPELLAAKFGDAPVNLSHVQRDTGLSYSSVNDWAKGRVARVDLSALEAWCKYLGADVGELLVYTPDTSN